MVVHTHTHTHCRQMLRLRIKEVVLLLPLNPCIHLYVLLVRPLHLESTDQWKSEGFYRSLLFNPYYFEATILHDKSNK